MEQACLSAGKTGKNISSVAGVDANSVRSVKTVNVHRGDIYYADLNPVCGSEQGGKRPVVVIQNDMGNTHAPTLIVATITTKADKRKFPTHYLVKENAAFDEPSTIMLEQLRTIDKNRVLGYLGKIPPKEMLNVDKALMLSLALQQYTGTVVKYIVKE